MKNLKLTKTLALIMAAATIGTSSSCSKDDVSSKGEPTIRHIEFDQPGHTFNIEIPVDEDLDQRLEELSTKYDGYRILNVVDNKDGNAVTVWFINEVPVAVDLIYDENGLLISGAGVPIEDKDSEKQPILEKN